MKRKGVGLLESITAGALLVSMTLPLVDLVTENARATRVLARRIVLELRARRHQAEAASTTYDALVNAAALPATLAEPDGAEAYAEEVRGVDEGTQVAQVAPGLAEVRTRLAWTGPEHRGGGTQLTSTRLIADPARSLRLSWPLAVVPR